LGAAVSATLVGRSSRGGGQTNSPGHNADQQVVSTTYGVRRLTPTECERLQGVPDGYTLVPYRGKPMVDGPRYKMLGNGWAIPVVAWIGKRIAAELILNGVHQVERLA
jgi:DNA (cytosine-5)-methyltransferase 1